MLLRRKILKSILSVTLSKRNLKLKKIQDVNELFIKRKCISIYSISKMNLQINKKKNDSIMQKFCFKMSH